MKADLIRSPLLTISPINFTMFAKGRFLRVVRANIGNQEQTIQGVEKHPMSAVDLAI